MAVLTLTMAGRIWQYAAADLPAKGRLLSFVEVVSRKKPDANRKKGAQDVLASKTEKKPSKRKSRG